VKPAVFSNPEGTIYRIKPTPDMQNEVASAAAPTVTIGTTADNGFWTGNGSEQAYYSLSCQRKEGTGNKTEDNNCDC
jgi:hypothetical protein